MVTPERYKWGLPSLAFCNTTCRNPSHIEDPQCGARNRRTTRIQPKTYYCDSHRLTRCLRLRILRLG